MTDANPKAAEPLNDDDAATSKARRIKDKIAASTARSSGKAPARTSANPKTAARSGPDERSFLTRALDDHPLALLAGSVVLGAVAASLIPASFMRKMGSRAFGFAALAGEMSALYGGKALERAARPPAPDRTGSRTWAKVRPITAPTRGPGPSNWARWRPAARSIWRAKPAAARAIPAAGWPGGSAPWRIAPGIRPRLYLRRRAISATRAASQHRQNWPEQGRQCRNCTS